MQPRSASASLSNTQESINKDYEARYTGDLPKFLGMPFQTLFIWLAARFPLLTDKAAISNKHNPSVDNADNFIIQAAGIVSGLFGSLIGWGLIKSGLIKAHKEGGKKPLNPSYRTYKTLAVIFQTLGSILILPVIFVDKVSQRLEMGFSAAIIGSLTVVAAPLMLGIREFLEKFFKFNEIEDLFKVAHDGWSKYMRTALYWGVCIGGIFGWWFLGTGFLGVHFNNLNTAVTFSGAIGGLGFCALSLIFVPLLNYISKQIRGKSLFGFSIDKNITDEMQIKEKLLEQRNCYRDNYFRAGISICFAIGAATFAAWGLVHGLHVDDLLGYAAWGGSIVGAVGGVGFALLAKRITAWVKKDATRNPWDYVLNNTGSLFGYAGITLGIIVGLVLFPADPLSGMALGSCLGRAGGNLLGVGVGCCWNSSPEECESKNGYWTQRMLLKANSWGIWGALGGVSVGLGIYIFSPILAIGPEWNLLTVLGASASIGTSALAFIGGLSGSRIAATVKSDQARSLQGMGVSGIHKSLPGSPGPSLSPKADLETALSTSQSTDRLKAAPVTVHSNGNGHVPTPVLVSERRLLSA